MRKINFRRAALGSVSVVGMALAFTNPAFAQGTVSADAAAQPGCDPNDANDADCQPGQSEQEIESGTVANADANSQSTADQGNITVTGSRIRRPNVESNVPVTSVSAAELTEQGDVSIGDALNDLPSLRSTFSQANSTRFIGTTGLNLLDLRGLGTNRTLVLVNGRRHITSQVGSFGVDVNTIPTDLVERVDIVTGGSSAVYGSDAIAGVVNFVLRRDFEGVRLRGQGGISSEHDRGIYFTSLTAGENLLDDRLNVAMNLEYAHAEPLFNTDRPGLTGAFSGRCQFNLAENTIGEPQAGNGIPDTRFQCGTRNNNISTGGLLFANVTAAQCQNPATAANLLARCVFPGTPQGQPRIVVFGPGGGIQESIPGQDQRPFGTGVTAIGGLGSTLRETGQLFPGLDRYTANFLASFEISPAFRPFVEAKYVSVFTEGSSSTFIPITFGIRF